MNKFEQIVTTIDNIKIDLSEAVSEKGVITPSDASFAEIKTNIQQITGGGYQPGDIIPGDQIMLLPFLIKDIAEMYAQHIIERDDYFVLVANDVQYYDKTLDKLQKEVTLTGVDLDNCHTEPVLVRAGDKDLLLGTTYDRSFFINDATTGEQIKKFTLSTLGCVLNHFIVETDGFYITNGTMVTKHGFSGSMIRSYGTGLPAINTANYCSMHKIDNTIYYLNKNYYMRMVLSLYDDDTYIPRGVTLSEFTTSYQTLFFETYFVVFSNSGIHYYDYSATPKLIKTIKASFSSRNTIKARVINGRIYYVNAGMLYYIAEDDTLKQIALTGMTGNLIGFDYVPQQDKYYAWNNNKLICLSSDHIQSWDFVFPKAGADDLFFKNILVTTDNKLIFSTGTGFYKIEKQPMYQLKHNAYKQ